MESVKLFFAFRLCQVFTVFKEECIQCFTIGCIRLLLHDVAMRSVGVRGGAVTAAFGVDGGGSPDSNPRKVIGIGHFSTTVQIACLAFSVFEKLNSGIVSESHFPPIIQSLPTRLATSASPQRGERPSGADSRSDASTCANPTSIRSTGAPASASSLQSKPLPNQWTRRAGESAPSIAPTQGRERQPRHRSRYASRCRKERALDGWLWGVEPAVFSCFLSSFLHLCRNFGTDLSRFCPYLDFLKLSGESPTSFLKIRPK